MGNPNPQEFLVESTFFMVFYFGEGLYLKNVIFSFLSQKFYFFDFLGAVFCIHYREKIVF